MAQKTTSDSEIFRAAVRLSPSERPAFLERACHGDRALRDEVESLLRAHDPEGSFMLSPAIDVTRNQGVSDECAGSVIGPYKLREQIGEGGFGIVFVAEQEHPVRRKVALKVIKPGMDSRQVIARFEAERQALAMMDHPNVARVLDAGTTDSGKPYFAMELVQGVTITDYCDRNNLPTRERLALFADVCRAVQHAHQKGIIHRDLKPSNVMVTLHDGKPVAKVIDFGVSKALSQQLTEKTIYTAYGQMIGTPSYMSPEQAEMSGLGIDTRSDIYSLGVLLYELLTGQTPLDAKRLRTSAYAEIQRIIREEEPPRPSQRISTLGKEATIVAQHRHSDPAQLSRDLAGELDWIVMKCLEKDRARRYETASGLARDIERYLKDEPVEACPPSALYRWSKFTRKHRALLTTAATFALLLVVGAAVSIWQAIRAQQAESVAKRLQVDAVRSLQNEQAARLEAETARQRAEGFSKRLREATQLDSQGVDHFNLRNWGAAHDCFFQAEQLEPDLATTYVHRAALYTKLGLWDRAAGDYDRFRIAYRSSPRILYESAVLKLWSGDETGYRQVCQELVALPENWDNNFYLIRAGVLSSKSGVDFKELARRAEDRLVSQYSGFNLHLVGRTRLRTGEVDVALDRLLKGLEQSPTSPGGVHRIGYALLAIAQRNAGNNMEAQKSLEVAEKAIDEWTHTILGSDVDTMPIDWWDWLEGQIFVREAATLVRGKAPDDDPRLIEIRDRALAAITSGDANQLLEQARLDVTEKAWDSAAEHYSKLLEILAITFRPGSRTMDCCVEIAQHPEVFARLTTLRPNDARLWVAQGQVMLDAEKWAEAAKSFDQVIPLLDPKCPSIAKSAVRFELAAAHLLGGDEVRYRAIVAEVTSDESMFEPGVTSQITSRTCTLLPIASENSAIADTAIRLAESATEIDSDIAWYQFALGLAQYRAGKFAEAEKSLVKSLQVHPTWVGRGQNFIVLAMVHQQLDHADQAQEFLRRAKEWLVEIEAAKSRSATGFASSGYLTDWLTGRILISEADRMIGATSPSFTTKQN